MKNFSIDTRRRHAQDLKNTKDEWIKKWSEHIEFLATKKENNSFRATAYDSIGILDRNDLMQEAYLAFLTAWNNVKWNEVNDAVNPDAFLWGFLKKSANLNLAKQIRKSKDGVRTPERVMENGAMRVYTSLFHQLDRMWLQTADDIGMPNYEAEILGFFLMLISMSF